MTSRTHPSSAPSSFVPRRIVVGAGDHAALTQAIGVAVPGLELRGNPHTALTADDLAWADTYVGFKPPPHLATMGNVRWVHCTGAGIDAWMYPRELSRDVLLTRTSESFGVMIAEWAVSRALAFTQRLREVEENQARREWKDVDLSFIRGSTAVVVGTGDVGTHIARAFAALGVRVIGVSRSGRADAAVFASAHGIDELPALVPNAHWLVLALPLTTATRAIIGHDVLSACRGAVLINAGRGGVVDEPLITRALDQGWLSGAALDVFATEPLPADSPLWSDRRVMVSPHLSGPTTIPAAVTGFVECIRSLERNEWPAWLVDRDREY
jgi:D-2-hydroxyacid dehydrogenase (NADP+)